MSENPRVPNISPIVGRPLPSIGTNTATHGRLTLALKFLLTTEQFLKIAVNS
jgi:hypothetical protein